jgi:hypothetical protein
MREQLENGCTIAALMEELDTLPEELDGLFEHILKSLKKPARKKAYLTLAMLTLLKKHGLALSLSAYSSLDEYERNPEFAMTPSFLQLGLVSMTREDRLKLAEKKLIGWCRGLVERDSASNLEYTHRSVPEFLQTATIKAEIASLTSGFNSSDAISKLVLADVRLYALRPDYFHSRNMALRVTSLVRMLRDIGLDQPPYFFLDCLGSSLNPALPEDMDQNDVVYVMQMMIAPGQVSHICETGSRRRGERRRFKTIMAPLYIMTFHGYHEYPMWKILHDPSTTDTVSKIILLAYCCMAFGRPNGDSGGSPNISVLQLLFERRLLSPNTKTHLWSVGAGDDQKASTQLTIWQHHLLNLTAMYHICKNNAYIWHGQIIEAFLRDKPDLDFTLSLTGPLNALVLELKLDKDQQNVLVPWDGGWSAGATEYKDLSPREWITLLRLENRERLLQLLDTQIKELELDAEEETTMVSYVEMHVDKTTLPQGVGQRTARPSSLLSSERSIHQDAEGGEPVSDEGLKCSRSLSEHIEHNKYFLILISGE